MKNGLPINNSNLSIRQKVTQSLLWVSIITYSTKALGFISTLILAKLLDPKDFGLIGIAWLVIATIQLVRQMGFNVALIQRQDDSVKAANTVFTLIFITSIVLYLACYGSAPFAANFFNNHAVEPLIKVLALSMIIGSLSNVQSTLLQKKMDFKKKVIPDVLPRIGYIGLAVTLAYMGYGVWSMVFATLFSSVMGVILYWIISPYKPRFGFDKKIAKELFRFGKWVIASSIAIFIFARIDDAFIGKFLDVTALGYYSFAFGLAYLPARNITFLASTVNLPAFSSIQNDRKRLKRGYLETVKYIALFVIPVSFSLIIFARPALELLYGNKWLPAVPCLQVLAVYGLIVSLFSPIDSVFLATGKSKLTFYSSLITLLITIPFIYHTTIIYGILGMSILVTISNVLGTMFMVIWLKKLIYTTYSENWFCIRFPLLLSILLSAITAFLMFKISLGSNVWVIIISFTFYCLSYFLISYWLNAGFRSITHRVFNKVKTFLPVTDVGIGRTR